MCGGHNKSFLNSDTKGSNKDALNAPLLQLLAEDTLEHPL